MKTLIIMPAAEQRGGAELALIHLIERRTPGMEWHVVFLEDGPMVEQFRLLGAAVDVIVAGKLRQVGRFFSTIVGLASVARCERVDAILSWMGKPHLYGSWAGMLTGIPTLWFQHGLPSRRNAMDLMIASLPAGGILACSETVAKAQGKFWPTRPVKVVYPGVDLARHDLAAEQSPLNARRDLGLSENGPLIGMVGRLQRWKGMHVLIHAMTAVRAAHPQARCVIVGGEHSLEPEYRGELMRQIDAAGLNDTVQIVGLQQNTPQWMQAMDIVVHGAQAEPFGMVVIEGMALSKPIIAGREGGPTEIVTDGLDGVLCPYGDSTALAEAVIKYLDDPEMARSFGQAARRRAADFSTERYARSVEDAVISLVSESEPRSSTIDVRSA